MPYAWPRRGCSHPFLYDSLYHSHAPSTTSSKKQATAAHNSTKSIDISNLQKLKGAIIAGYAERSYLSGWAYYGTAEDHF